MKKVCSALCLLCAFALNANAESINAGGKNISFKIPQGYVRGTDEKYSMSRDLLVKAMPSGMTVHGIYAPADVHKKFMSDKENLLEKYLVVVSDSRRISDKTFNEVKAEVVQNYGKLGSDQMRERVNDSLNRLTDGGVQMGNLRSLGAFDLSDDRVSFLLMVTQTVNTDAEQISFEQAMISTMLRIDDRLIMVNQYAVVTVPEEVETFRAQAPGVIAEMDFPTGKRPLRGGLIGAIAVLLVLAAIFFLRRKRKAGPPGPA